MRSDEDNKAYVTSLYAMAIAVGYIVGPLAAGPIVRAASVDATFFTAAAIAVLSAVVVLVRLEADPPTAHHDAPAEADGARRDPVWRLLARIRTSCFATFAYGYFQSSVVLFLPLYLVESKQISREATIFLPAFFAAGMLLFSNAAGRAGDRLGHLFVMRVLGVAGLAMVLAFVLLDSFAAMAAAVFAAGAALASISPLSLALQGVVTSRHEYARANAVYNAFYASGMLLGPPASSVVFQRYGGAVMLYHLAGLWTAFVLFAILFAADDPAHRTRARAATASLLGSGILRPR
jgi:MFS family permease